MVIGRLCLAKFLFLPRSNMKSILHKIAHLLKINKGTPDAFYRGEKMYMSFLCAGCDERSDIFPCDDIIDRELRKELES